MATQFLTAKYNSNLRTVDYAAADGSHLLRTGGTIAWRFNNPGNLRPAKKGKPIYGAIGVGKTKSNGEFLIFSSYEEGRKQKKALLRRKYNERTIYTMLAGVEDSSGAVTGGYAPESDSNAPEKYADAISSHTGFPTTKNLSDLTDAQLDAVLDAMESHEGYHGQQATRKEKIVNTTSITISDGAQPKPGLAVKLEVAGKTTVTKTNDRGQLAPIPHLDIGKKVELFLTSLNGGWEKAFDFVIGDQSKAYSISNGVRNFLSSSDLKKPDQPDPPAKRTSIRYVVQPGDTLAKVAKRYKTSVPEIQRDNPQIKDATKIFPSQVLTLYGDGPGATAVHGKTVSTTPIASQHRSATRPINTTDPVRSKEGTGAPLALIQPNPQRAPWMEKAIAEAKKWKGQTEDVITKTSNYHALNGMSFLTTLEGKKNAWCASFVNYCLSHCVTPYTNWKNSFRAGAVALDTINFVEIKTPIYGCIGLLGTHHVTFVYGISNGIYVCLGGNQGDQINFSYMGKKLRFFVPIAYYEFAKKDIALGNTLQGYTPENLNKAFGIKIQKKEKNALT